MKGGILRYRCRMCGEEYQAVHVPNIILAMIALTGNNPCPWPQSAGQWPGLIDVHNHLDGSSGAADFIGAVEDKD